MDATLWARIKEAFSVAISCGPDAADEALFQTCGGDNELLRQVRPLVEEHFRILNEVEVRPHTEGPDTELPGLLACRYRVLNRLGGGSFGDVYKVSDEGHGGQELALKILRSSDPLALHYFKREFRSLADTYHPNIVKLRELVAFQGRWMFTMEFVDGVDLIRFLNQQASGDRGGALRACFLQLGEGLRVLHQGRLLHRDVKPSNILVTATGRLVLLDFGLAHSFDKDPQSGITFAGTPDYMSPEQAAGTPVAESSDWYAFGVLMYQSLVGKLPFQGTFVEVLRRKQFEDPIPPANLAPDVPPELNRLCLSLLQRDPLKRASYADILRSLKPGTVVPAYGSQRPRLIGRREPLESLAKALEAMEDRPALIHICGPSGIGKTVLLREFISNVSKDPSTLVLAGRCYEGETVPFQALDDLIDHLSDYFRRLPRERVESILPRHFEVLVKMFPVLAPYLFADRPLSPILNSVELRTRALAALRELLGRLRERNRIVLVIDDLQWGDTDGCMALNDLLSSSDSPGILVILAYRSEDIWATPPIKALREAGTLSRNTTFIELDHLGISECQDLAFSLSAVPLEADQLHLISEHSGGNPLLVHEIVRWINARGPSDGLNRTFSLADVVRSRVDALRPDSHHVLELSAVAGQPTELSILRIAGGIDDPVSARDELLSNRLLRSRTVRGREEVEIYHDRIRATLLAEMEPMTLIRRHRELARALESAGARDPERIAAHYEEAQDKASCAKYALVAARHAADVLAFHDASHFYEMALRTRVLDPRTERMAHLECANAFANAGRGLQAAEHYLAACAEASINERLECNVKAAEELLYSGYVDRGLDIFRQVLEQVGIKEIKKTSRIPFLLMLRRARLRLRGMRWQDRSIDEVPREVLIKIDTCSAVATGLALIDVTRGAALQAVSLLLALRAGEPSRIARALAMEAGYRSTVGVKGQRRAEDLLTRARDLALQTKDARAVGLTNIMGAACAWNAGHWQKCHERACLARDELRDRHERTTWERDTASIFEVDALRWMGHWAKMKAILPELIEDARHRGDLYAETILQMHAGSCANLADDAPGRALDGLKIVERWSHTSFHIEHLVDIHNQVEIALYRGDGRRAFAIVMNRWPELKRSFLLRIQTLNIQMRSLRARAALAALSSSSLPSDRSSLLKLVQQDIGAITREGADWGSALGELIQGGAELFLGRRESAINTFARAETSFNAVGMHLHRVVACRSLNLLIGNVTGRQRALAAEVELQNEGIVNPQLFANVIAPSATT